MIKGSFVKSVLSEPFELNSGDYMVEIGTFVPMRKQLEEMKRAGVDLMAHRMAHSDFLAGETIDLDSDFTDWRELDEFDLDAKREFFLRQELLNAKLQEESLRAQAEKDSADLAEFRKQKKSETSDKSE